MWERSIDFRLLEAVFDALLRKRHVDLCRADAGVAHELFELVDVEVRLDQLPAEGVSQHVRRKFHVRGFGYGLEDGVEILAGELRS